MSTELVYTKLAVALLEDFRVIDYDSTDNGDPMLKKLEAILRAFSEVEDLTEQRLKREFKQASEPG